MERCALHPRRSGPLLFLFVILLTACGSEGASLSNTGLPDSTETDSTIPPSAGGDSTLPPGVPPDTLPIDSAPPPVGDTLSPPADSTPPEPPVTVNHLGIPFGPFALPSAKYGPDFIGAYRPPWDSLLADLEVARRTNTRVVLNFTGPEHHFADGNGFNMTKWKQLVDRFRPLDLTSYIADGTIVGHFLMDEPNDASNWNGKRVSPAEVEEMARYSKEIWPAMATLIRGWPAYLKGYEFKYLDAAWAQYHERFGSIDEFIANNVRDAREAGLALVAGMNVLNGGSSSSGITGRRAGKYAMSASELRSWGNALLSEPYICALLIWKYDPGYFSRPDISAALSELNRKAESHPEQPCRR